MASVELAIVIGGQIADRTEIPIRKAKVVLADIAPDANTPAEKAAALLEHLLRLARLDLKAVTLGERQCDKMMQACEWTAEQVMAEGVNALEEAYDAI